MSINGESIRWYVKLSKIQQDLSSVQNRRSHSSSRSSCVGARLVIYHFAVRLLSLFFRWSLLFAFSLNFSSPSAFRRSIFTQSPYLNCRLPCLMKLSCFFVSDLLGNLSSFVLTTCPAHFIWLVTLANCTSFSSNFFS